MNTLTEFLADLDAVCPKVGHRGSAARFLDDLEHAFAAAQVSSLYQPVATHVSRG
jgi:hypothetical protein